MPEIINLAEHYAGRFRWKSDPDDDGDVVTAMNAPHGRVVMSIGRDDPQFALLSHEEARSLASALLFLIDGECPVQLKEEVL